MSWVVNGRKVWTTYAQHSHWMIALLRTGEAGDSRHGGTSQFLIDLSSPGVEVRPIRNMIGDEEFNEVTFDNVFVPEAMLIGAEGEGWQQVTAELAFERSGPDRFLSAFALLVELVRFEKERPPGTLLVLMERSVDLCSSGDPAGVVDLRCDSAGCRCRSGAGGRRGQGSGRCLRAVDSGNRPADLGRGPAG